MGVELFFDADEAPSRLVFSSLLLVEEVEKKSYELNIWDWDIADILNAEPQKYNSTTIEQDFRMKPYFIVF